VLEKKCHDEAGADELHIPTRELHARNCGMIFDVQMLRNEVWERNQDPEKRSNRERVRNWRGKNQARAHHKIKQNERDAINQRHEKRRSNYFIFARFQRAPNFWNTRKVFLRPF